MKTKEEFKEFVNSHPSLVKNVDSGKTTWQKLFELYNLYDIDSNVWDEYISREVDNKSNRISLSTISSLINSINLSSFQNSLNNIQKVVSLIEEFTRKEEKDDKVVKNYKDSQIERFYND